MLYDRLGRGKTIQLRECNDNPGKGKKRLDWGGGNLGKLSKERYTGHDDKLKS